MPIKGGKVVHVRYFPSYDIYIGREWLEFQESKWHNPFHVGKDGNRQEVLAKYKSYILGNEELLLCLHELEDKILACWCKKPGLDQECHGDVLKSLANTNKFFRKLFKKKIALVR